MEWLANNWFLLVAAAAIIAAVVTFVIKFAKEPSSKQVENIKEWLRWAVVQAEAALGSGTGQLKLRMVYNFAVEKFPFIVNVISFSTFSVWVDEALEWMNEQLKNNNNIKSIVVGGVEDNGNANNLQ